MLLLENIKKNNFKEKSKTTSALTCLLGAVLLFNQTANAAPTTSAGTMTVTTSVTATCSVTATELAFGAFANSGSVANSSSGGVVSTNCSSALVHTLKVTESSASGVYTMITSDGVADEKKITFKLYTAANAGGTQLSEAVAFATATGSAVSAAVGTIFGQIAASQTGKEAGSYTASIALSVTYGS
jgi:hypothetical protein